MIVEVLRSGLNMIVGAGSWIGMALPDPDPAWLERLAKAATAALALNRSAPSIRIAGLWRSATITTVASPRRRASSA